MEQNRIYDIIRETVEKWTPEFEDETSLANQYGLTMEDMIYDAIKTVLQENHIEITHPEPFPYEHIYTYIKEG